MKFWTRAPKTTGSEHARAVSRSSTDWQAEAERLRAQIDALNVERATTVTEAGRAALDGQTARASDLTRRLGQITDELAVCEAAILAAQDRQSDAEADEARRRRSAQLRTYHAGLADWLEGTAAIKEAEAALTAAVQARNQRVDGELLSRQYADLVNAGIRGVVAREDLVANNSTAEAFRALAAHHRRESENVTLDERGAIRNEAEDLGIVPPTVKEQQAIVLQAEAEAAGPILARKTRLDTLEIAIQQARGTARRARDEHNRDAGAWEARLEALEAERDALIAALEEVPA